MNYNDLTRPHPKWWFMWGMAPQPSYFRLVKYYNSPSILPARDLSFKPPSLLGIEVRPRRRAGSLALPDGGAPERAAPGGEVLQCVRRERKTKL